MTMSNSPTYLRARSAEQKQERRRHLLDTAKSLLLEMRDVRALGINELARQAEMAKSNVYRYFESSEAVLLDVLVEEFISWHGELQKALGRCAKRGDAVEHIARAFSGTLAARPLLCRLISIFPSVLEHNVSAERMLQFKHGLLVMRRQTALDFHGCMPTVPTGTFERFIHLALPLISGLWPLSHPAELAAEVISRGDLAVLRYDLQGALHDALLVLLRGLLSPISQQCLV